MTIGHLEKLNWSWTHKDPDYNLHILNWQSHRPARILGWSKTDWKDWGIVAFVAKNEWAYPLGVLPPSPYSGLCPRSEEQRGTQTYWPSDDVQNAGTPAVVQLERRVLVEHVFSQMVMTMKGKYTRLIDLLRESRPGGVFAISPSICVAFPWRLRDKIRWI